MLSEGSEPAPINWSSDCALCTKDCRMLLSCRYLDLLCVPPSPLSPPPGSPLPLISHPRPSVAQVVPSNSQSMQTAGHAALYTLQLAVLCACAQPPHASILSPVKADASTSHWARRYSRRCRAVRRGCWRTGACPSWRPPRPQMLTHQSMTRRQTWQQGLLSCSRLRARPRGGSTLTWRIWSGQYK